MGFSSVRRGGGVREVGREPRAEKIHTLLLRFALGGLCLGGVATFSAAPAAAQGIRTGDTIHVTGRHAYHGVTPGAANLPPRARAATRRRGRAARLVTWPGFVIQPNGSSTFFLQTNQPIETDLTIDSQRIVVILRGTRAHLGNTYRALETRFFPTPVTRAYVERRGRNLAFVMDVRVPVAPQVTTSVDANGFYYVSFSFPAGTFTAR